MSTYLLWRRGLPSPLALITHDKHVRRAYLAPQEVIEFLLDHPSEAALRDCYVTNEVIEYPTPWTPLAVFLDRRPKKAGGRCPAPGETQEEAPSGQAQVAQNRP
jgi:hypothetical protein